MRWACGFLNRKVGWDPAKRSGFSRQKGGAPALPICAAAAGPTKNQMYSTSKKIETCQRRATMRKASYQQQRGGKERRIGAMAPSGARETPRAARWRHLERLTQRHKAGKVRRNGRNPAGQDPTRPESSFGLTFSNKKLAAPDELVLCSRW